MGGNAESVITALIFYYILMFGLIGGAVYFSVLYIRKQQAFTPEEWAQAFHEVFKRAYPKWQEFAASGSPAAAQAMSCKHRLEQYWATLRTRHRPGTRREEHLLHVASLEFRGLLYQTENRDTPANRIHSLYGNWKDAQIPSSTQS